jgi:hypothetical protein
MADERVPDPDGHPFYGGTYFRKPKFSLMAATTMSGSTAPVMFSRTWRRWRFNQSNRSGPARSICRVTELNQALQQLAGSFDPVWAVRWRSEVL